MTRKVIQWFTEEKHEKGQAIVELAIALPLLLLLLGGILDFGWIYSNQYKVQNAAYTGARYAAIRAQDYSNLSGNASARSQLRSAVESRVSDDFARWNAADDSVSLSADSNVVRVTVTHRVPTLTFVASTIYGEYYTATAVSSAAYQ